MNTTRNIIWLMAAGLAAGLQAQSAISPVANRTAVLDRLRAFSAPIAPSGVDYAGLKDPFHPPAADLRDQREVVPTTPVAVQRSESDVLTTLSAALRPTGSVVLGGEPILLFGEKRQKIGDKLTLAIEGVEYVVEIVNIENNQFRIRYKNEELTRPVK